jgi:hypothetical protein
MYATRNKVLQARSLCPHLSSTHDIHQQVVIADALLAEWAGVCYRANPGGQKDPIQCPYPGCPGVLSTPYMPRRHCQDLHPKDTVEILREGTFPWCEHCMMQCNPRYPWHIHTQVCSLGAEQRTQQKLAITAALALHKLFHVEMGFLEKLDLFWYLGWILAQDNDDVWTVRQQIKKARGIWARVGQVLTVDNTLPKVSTKFNKAVVQSALLYGSKTWNLTTTALAWLEGFHICPVYRIPRKHKPKKGPHYGWVYPWSSNILQECGMATPYCSTLTSGGPQSFDVWWTGKTTRRAWKENAQQWWW